VELITHMERLGDRLVAIGVGSPAARAGYDVEQLGLDGVPDDKSDRRRAETHFSDWDQASLSEYGYAFGLPVPPGDGHEVWSFQHNGTRFVVPALVLMRAMFRPNHFLLPHLFKPQSLEDVCDFVGGDAASRVALTGSLRNWTGSRERASTLEPLSWLYSFPSARAMWGSVLSASSRSRIGLELPSASARMVVHGKAHSKNFYATRIVVVSLTAQEAPLEFAHDHSRDICFHVSDERLASGFKPNISKDESIKLRGEESCLSDAEWLQIEPAVGLDSGRKFKHSPRAIVDAMLAKQSQGTSWTDTSYAGGIEHSTASTAFHRWRKDGRWAKVLQLLEQTR
jgi:hypothetical protein